MDVFGLRDDLIGAYREYATSFMRFRDARVQETVNEALTAGKLWPDPSVGLNPSFEQCKTVGDLVGDGVLHPSAEPIFRLDKDETDAIGRKLPLYLHQEQAIQAAAADRNYVLTTGTGSGKSLAYIIPIVDHVLRVGSGGGVKAIVVYPMNALVNSQKEELEKFLHYGPWKNPPVTFKRYTGQDDREARRAIQENPPDILLTNYVMLELILTRYTDRSLVRAFGNLRFLVLDELHSYRGRQGADVALLVRRLREVSGSSAIRCVGTSATLSTEGDHESRKKRLAEISSLLFGVSVEAGDVIGETLRRVTPEHDPADEDYRARLTEAVSSARPSDRFEKFVRDPLSCWIESTFGIRHEGDRLVRAVPSPIRGSKGAARRLADETGVDITVCEEAIQEYLTVGNKIESPDTRSPVFPFRLHQFISRGDTVYASPESTVERELSLSGQLFVPGSDQKRALLPLAFCRTCGQDYYLVHKQPTDNGERLRRRERNDNKERDDLLPGFVYLNEADPWPENHQDALNRLPKDWLDPDTNRLRSYRRDHIPQEILVNPDGSLGGNGIVGWWIPAPFRFCLVCGVTYSRGTDDFARLSTLGTEGRASATTVLSLTAARYLRENPQVDPIAQKVLSFTDNRQDASLQAGHFNDFVEVTMLRSALWQAVNDSPGGLSHDELPKRVFDALRLPRESYALDPDVRGWAEEHTDQTMREVLEYRLYHDLKRGWRVSQPNLEQAGLLVIEYRDLDRLAGDQEMWADCHPALADCAPERRKRLLEVLLDSLRRDLALNVKVLNHHEQESLQRRAGLRLNGSWSLDREQLTSATQAVTHPRDRNDRRKWIRPVAGRSLFGGYLRGSEGLATVSPGRRITLAETDSMIKEIFERLRRYGLLTRVGGKDDKELWQINADALIWKAGDGTRPYRDRLRVPRAPERTPTNRFFVDLYRNSGGVLAGVEAREHTAQVSNKDRMEREERFRTADLPVLYCSPTMELGVDISQLNVVNMRNVPPTPANYAQRSGRAGRGGQPALVFTYCSSGNSHDQYFFREPEKMISGQVEAPRIDLANEDLLRAHVHALWLAESGLDLGRSMGEILDLETSNGSKPTVKPHIRDALNNSRYRAKTRMRALAVIEDLQPHLAGRFWWSDKWIDNTLSQIPARFDKASERWVTLYTSAWAQSKKQGEIVVSATCSPQDRRKAKQLRDEAERQLEVLRAGADHGGQSDFYTYRYFAAEGFLPGYSFPRLPLSAFIPGRADRSGQYVQRPRFVAISEFGPQTYVYHEGARYEIERVILSRETDTPQQENTELTERMKRCEDCGYMHPPDRDVCERCSAELPMAWSTLLRMRNVSTRYRERITSDEEHRRRLGYELISGYGFVERDGRTSVTNTTVLNGDTKETLLKLSYGDTATIWRVNLGWQRRKNRNELGFLIDTERGEWATRDTGTNPSAIESGTLRRVVPYVEDSRNALLVEPVEPLDTKTMASLEAALKTAIQVVFQLESSELAAEPLPTRHDRRLLLLYESAEGGAGALRRLIHEPTLWRDVARAGLRLCHQDPDSKDEDSDSGCGGACYECLLTYQNQFDHELLDRTKAIPLLQHLLRADLPRVDPETLGSESTLESAFLAYLKDGGYLMPDRDHVYFPNARTEPDYLYDEACAAVYVDGPHHDYPDRAARDRNQEAALHALGFRTIRFGHRGDWNRIIAEHPDVFGTGHRTSGVL